jgi:hypothetical protein
MKSIRRSVLALEPLEDRTLPSFAAPTALDLGAAPNAVTTGHLEGASAPLDVVTANANGTVSVLLGKGDGSVQNPISITVGGTPEGVAVGDFLGNGFQDIAVANSNGTVEVILSNGNGTFQAPKNFMVGATPVGIAVGDFLGNGQLDVVTANSNGSVSVLAGNGKGAFAAPITTQIGDTLTSVAVGDFNNDGKSDLVVGTGTGLDILLGKGNGTFQLNQTVSFARTIDGIVFQGSATSVAVSDLRNNGKQDVVALANDGEVDVLLGNGNGAVQGPVAQTGGGTQSFVVGDFTGDGKQDIATSNAAGYFGSAPSVVVLVGKGDGTFVAGPANNLGESATALATGDFRGDGKLDLVMAGNNTVTVLPGNGNGTFATTPTVASNNLPYSIAAADFNGDGKPDLVTAGADAVDVVLNNGHGTFRPGVSLSINGVANALAVGDFTGNGKQDIAVAFNGTIDIFLGNGNGTFQAPKLINLGSNEIVRSLVAGNFNSGGLPDLAATVMLQDGLETSEIQVLKNTGNGTFAKGQSIHVGVDALGLAAADLNHDGKLDLVTTSMLPDGTRDVKVLLGNGNGTFGNPISTATGFSAVFVAPGDFNGNGKPGVVLVDYFQADNSVLVLPGNGDGTFGKPLVFKFQTPLGFATPAVGDFFGDGKQSFAIATGLGQVTVFRGNGDGTFQAPVNSVIGFTGSQPSALVAADFNGDGKLDLAATNTLGGTVSILLNTTPKPVTGTVATSVALTSDASTAVFGQPVTLTATVTADSGTATGSILFFDGNTLLGDIALDPNGQARLLVQLAPGVHSLRAVFKGLAPFTNSTSAALSETVNKEAITTALSVDTSAFGIDGFVLLTATILPALPGGGSPTGTVTFMEGNTVLGTAQVTGGQATLLFEGTLPPGKHTVRAIYSGDPDFLSSTSPDVTFTV